MRIASLWPMRFRDRQEAAKLLSKSLLRYRGRNPLVLAIPRGAVPMAKIIADQLEGDLDVVLVHKIGAPGNPEFAIGSVSEFGHVYRSEAVEFFELPEDYFQKASQEEIAKLKERRKTYSPIRAPISPKGRIAIIIDDGIATGATMLAAIRAIRGQQPARIVVSAPVAAPSAAEILRAEADEAIFLDTPEEFFAIGEFYDTFTQVEDEDVITTLSSPSKRKAA